MALLQELSTAESTMIVECEEERRPDSGCVHRELIDQESKEWMAMSGRQEVRSVMGRQE